MLQRAFVIGFVLILLSAPLAPLAGRFLDAQRVKSPAQSFFIDVSKSAQNEACTLFSIGCPD